MKDAFPGLIRWQTVALLLAMALVAGCAGKDPVPVDPSQADRFLLDRGNQALAKKRWPDARQYYRQVVDNYPSSGLRAEAKLGVGETYLGEHSAESLVLAAAEFREFLNYYPTNPLADRAQFKLAMSYFAQMHPADRDQTPTHEALAELARFFDRFPESDLIPEAREKYRTARNRISEASYRVGLTYYKRKWFPGAAARFRELMKEDPEFSGMDGVVYHLAETLARADNKAEAIPLFDRVVTQYPASEHVEKAQKRLKELQATQPPAAAAAPRGSP
jgi:outer membrane protein assembly factor BamD